MPNSYKLYTANGSTTNFTFAEIDGWISSGFLKVYLDNVLQTTGYSFQNLNTASPSVEFTTAPANGVAVKIQRETPSTVSGFQGNIVNFNNGSVLTEEDLDNMAKGLLHITQEAEDTGSGALGPTLDAVNWDANNKRITNLGEATQASDAVSKGYVDAISLYGSAIAAPQSWTFTTVNGQLNYTLSPAAVSTDPNMFILDIGGVIQRPNTNFTVTNNGATLTLVANPGAGLSACLRNFGATRNVASFAAPVTFNSATTTNANATVNGTLTATNLTSTGVATLDGIVVSNGTNDATTIVISNSGGSGMVANAGNTHVGVGTAPANQTGTGNVSLGYNANMSLISGSLNVAVGAGALTANSNQNSNVAVGYAALNQITSGGGQNIAIGVSAGRYITGGSTPVTNMTNGVCLGYAAYPKQNSSTNEIVIGANAVGEGSNTSTIGNSSTTAAKIYGNLTTTGNLNVQGIGTTSISGPVAASGNMTVGGTLGVTGNTTLATATINGNVTFGTATQTTPTGNAPIFGVRAWVNFDATTLGSFAGGASTVVRPSGSTTATITTTNDHGLLTGHGIVIANTTGFGGGTFVVTVLTSKTFTVQTPLDTGGITVGITIEVLSIRASGNISSVAKTGTGNYIINFATAMPDTNYAFTGSIWQDNRTTPNQASVYERSSSALNERNTASFRISVTHLNTAAYFDNAGVYLMVMR